MPIFSNYKCFEKCATLCFQKCVTFVSIEKYKSNDRMTKSWNPNVVLWHENLNVIFSTKMSAEKGCIFSSMYDFEFQFSCVSARAQYILEPLKRKKTNPSYLELSQEFYGIKYLHRI